MNIIDKFITGTSLNNTYFQNGGIFAEWASDLFIVNNTFSENFQGMFIWCVDNVTVRGNVIFGSTNNGVALYPSISNMHVFQNNFIDNINHADTTWYNTSSGVDWKSPVPMKYSYDGANYSGYLGNYWDTYGGVDADGNGVGDTPFVVDGSDKDRYPLTERFGQYSVQGPEDIPHLLLGDANIDGLVNQADTLLVLKEVVGLEALPEMESDAFTQTDVHCNCCIDVGDAMYIAQYNVGLRDASFGLIEQIL